MERRNNHSANSTQRRSSGSSRDVSNVKQGHNSRRAPVNTFKSDVKNVNFEKKKDNFSDARHVSFTASDKKSDDSDIVSANGLLPFQEKKRDILVRVDEPTSDKYGSRPENRTMQELIEYGIICLDKPPGPTSHQVSAYTKQILGVKKTGHSGSLDPNVTGILVIASGRATRIAESLLKAGKEYVCVMHLHESIPEDKIREVMSKFEGKIKQLPPLKSAVKRQFRFRKVYYNDIIEISEDGRDVLFRTGVQAGTYIRKLVHDIGQELGCGAHMAELRRTRVATFGEESNMCTLHDLKDAFTLYKDMNNENLLRKYIVPIERAVEFLPKVWIRDSAVGSICHGANLNIPGIAKVETGIEPDLSVALMSLKDELVAVGTAKINSQKMQKDERGFAIKVDKVFMLPDIYPKMS